MADSFREQLSELYGRPVRNDIHGLDVFDVGACEESPQFASFSASGVVHVPADRIVRLAQEAVAEERVLSNHVRLAYDLYNGASAQIYPEARLVMLTMALETLIDQGKKESGTIAHIDTLIAATVESGVPGADALCNALRGLKNESVGQAGRRLVECLEPRTYMDETPSKFFDKLYKVRSKLVHGTRARPSHSEMDIRAAHTEVFVSDLLSKIAGQSTSP